MKYTVDELVSMTRTSCEIVSKAVNTVNETKFGIYPYGDRIMLELWTHNTANMSLSPTTNNTVFVGSIDVAGLYFSGKEHTVDEIIAEWVKLNDEAKGKNNLAEAFHPGEYLKDELDARSISVEVFAKMINLPIETINSLFSKKIKISHTLASRIEDVLNINAETWVNLQNLYDKQVILNENKNKKEII